MIKKHSTLRREEKRKTVRFWSGEGWRPRRTQILGSIHTYRHTTCLTVIFIYKPKNTGRVAQKQLCNRISIPVYGGSHIKFVG